MDFPMMIILHWELTMFLSFADGLPPNAMEWYSGRLLLHADDILAKAANIPKKYPENKQTSIILAAKIGGIYWWYQAIAHPAELIAGYYNTAVRDGYDPVASLLFRHGGALHVPCLEMMDGDNQASCLCSPEGLLQQLRGLLINNASLGSVHLHRWVVVVVAC
ncbi:inactive beta-amylase 4, chloroplastic-like isoform X2 [Malus domestica]|uniref:inactive beta-amylase 4, chloroplastic-like isoform X2 n=1 Tax=Malus domestica TaxID=3750 RepID=UPI003975AF0D